MRFALVSLAFHLLVSFAGFTDKGHINGFWQFNKALFLRILASALYGVVLFLGLAAALGAMNFLFNTDFKYDVFLTLWAWITGMFITIFFLAGVPANINDLDGDNTYPKALKIFTQYVLIPLATVYVIILLAYEVKILIEWRLPKGMVSDMILGYAVFGILSLLLLYPIRNLDENKWLKTFARSFYFLMIPLIVLLFLAVGTRIFKYGITEYRYFLIMLSCWLCFITVYFLTSKKQNIKLIPVSLCVLSLLAVYGPQSAFSVSMYSQRRVLVGIFKKYNAFENGKLQSLKGKNVVKKDGKKAVATLDYLVHEHDLISLQPYFARDLNVVDDSIKNAKSNSGERPLDLRFRKIDWVKDNLGLDKYSWNRYRRNDDDTTEDQTKPYFIDVKDPLITEIRGYDYSIDLHFSRNNEPVHNKELKYVQRYSDESKGTYTILIDGEKYEFNVTLLERKLIADKTIAQYKTHDNDYVEGYSIPQEMMMLSDTTKQHIVTLKISLLRFDQTIKNGEIKPSEINGTYYIKVKP